MLASVSPKDPNYPFTNPQDNVMHYVFHATSCGLSSQKSAKDEVNQNFGGHRSPKLLACENMLMNIEQMYRSGRRNRRVRRHVKYGWFSAEGAKGRVQMAAVFLRLGCRLFVSANQNTFTHFISSQLCVSER